MYFHVCVIIFELDKSILVKIKFFLLSIMVCTPKHMLTHRPSNDCRGYNFEARLPLSTVS